eukprot:766545-Hanusia_phi.AAC.10
MERRERRKYVPALAALLAGHLELSPLSVRLELSLEEAKERSEQEEDEKVGDREWMWWRRIVSVYG